MDFKDIKLSDRETILKFYTPEKVFGAHQSFTNMFIWQEGYHIGYCTEDDFLCVISRHHRQNPYFVFPEGEGDLNSILCKIMDYAHSLGFKCVFSQLSENQVEYLKDNFKDRFTYEDHRHSAEYVYEVEKMISLSGKKLHSKRNFVNTFKANYDYEYKEISKDNIAEIKAFCLDCVVGEDDRDEEILSINKLFDNFEALRVCGAALYIDGKVIAATVGEMLTRDTAVIHLEKAQTDFRGSYAAINNMFLQNRFSDVKYVNREEDMGIDGLRQAKLSYHPCSLVHKYVAIEI